MQKKGWGELYTDFNSYFSKRSKITGSSFSQNIFLQRYYESYIKLEQNVAKKEKKGEFHTEFNCYSCKIDIKLLCGVLYSQYSCTDILNGRFI